jgi:SSS family solute:Na+ symporter
LEEIEEKMESLLLILGIVILHLGVVLFIGWFSWKASKPTPEDYFMGSRTFGTLALVLSIYATNMTAFYMIGVPGMAYHRGIGLYGYVAFGTAIITGALYYLVGYRAWLLGKEKGYMTQPEFYGKRWNSDAVSIVFFILLLIFTIPYLCVSVIGGGLAIHLVTKGAVSYPLGASLILVIVATYVTAGGMRGTAWVNVYQGFVFMIVGVICFILLGDRLGGLCEITGRALIEKAQLFMRAGNFTPREWFSYLLISPLAVIVFPHVFMKLLIGKRALSLKRLTFWYPIMVLLTWPPVIYIGIWGAVLNPGLEGKASDAILPWMIAQYLPTWLSGVALAGILAALMSSIDAMFLSLSTMLTRDILLKFFPDHTKGKEVMIGRFFIVFLSALVFFIAIYRPSSIFVIATFAFSGYVVAAPAMIGGLIWKRGSKHGALASLIIPGILIPVYQFTPILNWSTFGFLYNIPVLILSAVLFIGVSLLTSSPGKAYTDEYFQILDRVYGRR